MFHPGAPSTIIIANRQRARKINRRLLQQIADALFADLDISKPKLEINLVTTGEMTRLNEKFLHHAGSTDVITFNYAENAGQKSYPPQKTLTQEMEGREACPTLHGEIFICVEEAVLQAQTFRTHWQSEIVRYLIHGVLHLLGHDDARADQRRKMKRVENRLLRRLSRRFSLAPPAGVAKLSACINR